jgi:MFS-type transporter involved in bile tolerance (Atg22 family)
VFALQEVRSQHGSPWIWAMFAAGAAMMAAFVYWQSANKGEPLFPLRVFNDRNFSVSSLGVGVVAFVWTAMVLPVMFFAQTACGLSATRAALLTAPMAVATAGLAPVVGRIVDRAHPRRIIGVGFAVLAVSLGWLSIEMTAATPIWRLLLPFAGAGVGMALLGAPLAATAMHNLPRELAGAGSGAFTATRQVGSVLGSASMASLMDWLVIRQLPPIVTGITVGVGGEGPEVEPLPAFRAEFATAMSQSMLLPTAGALLGVVAALFLVGFPRRPESPDALPESAEGGH